MALLSKRRERRRIRTEETTLLLRRGFQPQNIPIWDIDNHERKNSGVGSGTRKVWFNPPADTAVSVRPGGLWTPGMEDTASNMEDTPGFDMENRDPNNINNHLQILWDDLVAEPEGLRSFNWLWRASYLVYRFSMDCCYGLLTVLCAIPLSCCIGINFACIAFQHVWCVGPALREWRIKCHAVRNFFRIGLNSVCGPCCETCGLFFSQIHVRQQKVDGKDRLTEDV